MRKENSMRRLIVFVLMLFLVSCSSSGSKTSLSNKIAIKIEPRQDTIKGLVEVGDSRFKMSIPSGWEIEPVGDFQNFGFKAYDPKHPARVIFYYGTMSPWIKSEESKSFWQWYSQTGYPNSKVYADAPILQEASIESLYQSFDQFTLFAQQYGIVHTFPQFNNFEVLERFNSSTAMADNALDESTLRLKLTVNDQVVDALVGGTLVNAMTYYANGIDTGYYTAYRVSGIIAPTEDLIHHGDLLLESLASFQYTQEYIDEGVALIEWGTQKAKEIQQTLNQTSQIIHDAWTYRNQVNDAANREFSAYIRGKSYLQDPNSKDIYEGDHAFVEEYLKDPTKFSKNNLVPLTKESSAFSNPISGIITN